MWKASAAANSDVVLDGQVVRLSVTDDGGNGAPTLVDASDRERGRGLQVVRGLSAAYWYSGDADGREVGAEIPWNGVPVEVPVCQSMGWSPEVGLQ